MKHPTDTISYTPVQCMCSGVITSLIDDEESYEVRLYDSPMADFSGPVYATLMYNPGTDGNFKQGDHVKVMVNFAFGGAKNDYDGVMPGTDNYIMGMFNERTMATKRVESPLAVNSPDHIRYLNNKSDAGLIATDSGDVVLASGGSIQHVLKPFGYGLYRNMSYQMAQNHHRIVSHNPPYYFAREHFGMYDGADIEDESSRLTDEDFPMIYRRFVTQTRSPNNWVSTCEGTYAPWVGANIEEKTVTKNKDVLFTKIVNFMDSRATIEMGKPGAEFINIRVDDIKDNEKSVPVSPGATPALVGNRFKLTISDKGELDLRAASKADPSENLNAFHLKIDEDGLTIHSKGRIALSHGDEDESNNSIVLDPKKGIDITALNGFRVNDQEVLLKSFIEFLSTYRKLWCQSTSPGGPAFLHPAIEPFFDDGIRKFAEKGGFTSIGKSESASGVIKDRDRFPTV